MKRITYAVCTYNRAARLPNLIRAMRAQECPIELEILVVDNNSSDETQQVLACLAAEPGAPLRIVHELEQGIVPARNRAIIESMNSTYMAFIDDDELPRPGLLVAAIEELMNGADCVGGRVHVNFEGQRRPRWLTDDLLGFLAEVDYGQDSFTITGLDTPLWTANVAYRTSLFRDGLRFDQRYNRAGQAVGGGEDLAMFEALYKRSVVMRYCPRMVVDHFVEAWRLKRRYFLKLHYTSGVKSGIWELPHYKNEVFGIPPFLFRQAASQWLKSFTMLFGGTQGVLRQAMNGAHATGLIIGAYRRRHISDSMP